jgi:hypothetical protein
MIGVMFRDNEEMLKVCCLRNPEGMYSLLMNDEHTIQTDTNITDVNITLLQEKFALDLKKEILKKDTHYIRVPDTVILGGGGFPMADCILSTFFLLVHTSVTCAMVANVGTSDVLLLSKSDIEKTAAAKWSYSYRDVLTQHLHDLDILYTISQMQSTDVQNNDRITSATSREGPCLVCGHIPTEARHCFACQFCGMNPLCSNCLPREAGLHGLDMITSRPCKPTDHYSGHEGPPKMKLLAACAACRRLILYYDRVHFPTRLLLMCKTCKVSPLCSSCMVPKRRPSFMVPEADALAQSWSVDGLAHGHELGPRWSILCGPTADVDPEEAPIQTEGVQLVDSERYRED